MLAGGGRRRQVKRWVRHRVWLGHLQDEKKRRRSQPVGRGPVFLWKEADEAGHVAWCDVSMTAKFVSPDQEVYFCLYCLEVDLFATYPVV